MRSVERGALEIPRRPLFLNGVSRMTVKGLVHPPPLNIIHILTFSPVGTRGSTLRKFRTRLPEIQGDKFSGFSGFWRIPGDSKGSLRILGDSQGFSGVKRMGSLKILGDSTKVCGDSQGFSGFPQKPYEVSGVERVKVGVKVDPRRRYDFQRRYFRGHKTAQWDPSRRGS